MDVFDYGRRRGVDPDPRALIIVGSFFSKYRLAEHWRRYTVTRGWLLPKEVMPQFLLTLSSSRCFSML